MKKNFGISWSVKKLKGELSIPKLDLWTNKNRVSSKPPTSKVALESAIEYLEEFKKAKTHTVRGIKNVIKKQKENIKQRFAEMKRPIQISDIEAEYLYMMFEDKDTQFFIDKIGASTFQNEIHNIMEADVDFDYMLDRFSKFFDGEFDEDVIEKLNNIYNIILAYKSTKQPYEALDTLKKWGVKY